MTLNQTLEGQLFIQSNHLLVSDMNGEKVLMSVSGGKYYNLGRVGGRIWDVLQRPSTIEQVTVVLLSEYEIDQTTCEVQVRAFMQMLYNESLIFVSEST